MTGDVCFFLLILSFFLKQFWSMSLCGYESGTGLYINQINQSKCIYKAQ